jgi:hypothetical protein
MNPAGPIARVSRLAVALLLLAGCSGESVRLGDVDDVGGAGGAAPGAEGGAPAGAGSETAGAGGINATGGSRSGGAAGNAAEGGSAGAAEACVRGATEANEVLWIGDSWVEYPGTQLSRLRELAQLAGTIDESESYATRAVAAASLAAIVEQYEAQQASGPPVKVLLMNGGTWDTIEAQGDDASVARVMVTFNEFLSKVGSDGTVEHIVYFLQPELPSIPGVAKLRPLLLDACGASAVPCHFLDLDPIWQGHAEYTGPSQIQASEAGGAAIAEAIWDIMQEHCIAQ